MKHVAAFLGQKLLEPPESDVMETEDDTMRHPFVARLLERSAMLMKLVRGPCDPDSKRWLQALSQLGQKNFHC